MSSFISNCIIKCILNSLSEEIEYILEDLFVRQVVYADDAALTASFLPALKLQNETFIKSCIVDGSENKPWEKKDTGLKHIISPNFQCLEILIKINHIEFDTLGTSDFINYLDISVNANDIKFIDLTAFQNKNTRCCRKDFSSPITYIYTYILKTFEKNSA